MVPKTGSGKTVFRVLRATPLLLWALRIGPGLCPQWVNHPKTGENWGHVDILCTDNHATAARVEKLAGRCFPGP